MSLYDSNGQIRLTVVPGTSFTGLYASDGSWNVVTNDGTGAKIPLTNSCGAINATITTNKYAGFYSANNSMNVIANSTGYTPVSSTFVPNGTIDNSWVLSGAIIDMDFQHSRFFGGTLATLMDGTQTSAIGALLAAFQSPSISVLLSLKATGTSPSGTTWINTDTILQIAGATGDTTFRCRKGASILNITLGIGAFSTTPSKIAVGWDVVTGRSVVGNNGTLVSDTQAYVAATTVTFVNVLSQFNRLTIYPARQSDAILQGLTV